MSKRLEVEDLVTHVFGIDEAERAYETIGQDPKALAVQFSYPGQAVSREPITLRPVATGHRGSGIVGAGNYAKMTFLPAMKKAGSRQSTTCSRAYQRVSSRASDSPAWKRGEPSGRW